jgi:hypothetical protein
VYERGICLVVGFPTIEYPSDRDGCAEFREAVSRVLCHAIGMFECASRWQHHNVRATAELQQMTFDGGRGLGELATAYECDRSGHVGEPTRVPRR